MGRMPAIDKKLKSSSGESLVVWRAHEILVKNHSDTEFSLDLFLGFFSSFSSGTALTQEFCGFIEDAFIDQGRDAR